MPADIVAVMLGAIAIAAILHDAFEVMLLPRRVKSNMRIVRYFFQATWLLWSKVSGGLRSEDMRQGFLGLYGPLSLVLLLLVWASGLIFSFGTIFWALNPTQFTSHHWLNQVYFSGATFFTLGYGDIVPHGAWSKVICVLEAGTGLGFIAMVIGYLPVLYQLFSRREAHVIMLDSVTGSPPNSCTLLFRFAEGRNLDGLDGFLLRWQQWSAELLESQLSYPMLAYYRSQHDNQSWLAALTVILDACVLIMTGFDGVRTFQARLTFATARLAVIEMLRVLSVKPRPLERDRLSAPFFQEVKARLADADLLFVDENEAEERLVAFRSTYEPFLHGLAHHLLLSLPDWKPDPEHVDNWVNSPRGRSAKRLLDSVSPEPEITGGEEKVSEGSRARN
jgi:Ion channel